MGSWSWRLRDPASRALSDRIPSLDGLRTVAIAIVLVSHASLLLQRAYPGIDALRLLQVGTLGVRLFFVLSGFLITGILIRQLEQGGIRLRRFYLRRTLRIFPAYYSMLLTLLGLSLAGAWPHLQLGRAWPAALYLTDYAYSQVGWMLVHTWSLAIEEQFYIFWPLILMLLGLRRGLWVAVAVMLSGPLLRVWTLDWLGSTSSLWQYQLHTQADSLATGCLLVALRPRLHGLAWYRKLIEPRSLVVWAGLAILIREFPNLPPTGRIPTLAAGHVLVQTATASGSSFPPAIASGLHGVSPYATLGPTLMNLLVALCLDGAMTHHRTALGRALNARPVVLVGIMSYSIYVWQELFVNVHTPILQTHPVLAVVVAVAAGAISYLLVERTFLRVRQSLESKLLPPAGEASEEVSTATEAMAVGLGMIRPEPPSPLSAPLTGVVPVEMELQS